MAIPKKAKAKGKPVKAKSKPAAKKAASKKSKAVKVIADQSKASADTEVEVLALPAAEPPMPISSEPWSELAVGHIVAAFDKRGAGYFPAMIVAMGDGKLVMRWHKYEEDTAKFTRKAEQVALIHPSVKS